MFITILFRHNQLRTYLIAAASAASFYVNDSSAACGRGIVTSGRCRLDYLVDLTIVIRVAEWDSRQLEGREDVIFPDDHKYEGCDTEQPSYGTELDADYGRWM